VLPNQHSTLLTVAVGLRVFFSSSGDERSLLVLHRAPDVAERLHLLGHLGSDPVGDRLSEHERRCHGRESSDRWL
jgi:hypothetical protein